MIQEGNIDHIFLSSLGRSYGFQNGVRQGWFFLIPEGDESKVQGKMCNIPAVLKPPGQRC